MVQWPAIQRKCTHYSGWYWVKSCCFLHNITNIIATPTPSYKRFPNLEQKSFLPYVWWTIMLFRMKSTSKAHKSHTSNVIYTEAILGINYGLVQTMQKIDFHEHCTFNVVKQIFSFLKKSFLITFDRLNPNCVYHLTSVVNILWINSLLSTKMAFLGIPITSTSLKWSLQVLIFFHVLSYFTIWL